MNSPRQNDNDFQFFIYSLKGYGVYLIQLKQVIERNNHRFPVGLRRKTFSAGVCKRDKFAWNMSWVKFNPMISVSDLSTTKVHGNCQIYFKLGIKFVRSCMCGTLTSLPEKRTIGLSQISFVLFFYLLCLGMWNIVFHFIFLVSLKFPLRQIYCTTKSIFEHLFFFLIQKTWEWIT